MTTRDVASFITAVNFDELPPSVVVRARVAVLDCLGVALAAHEDRAVDAARNVAMETGGAEESTLIGTTARVPCAAASWVNAVMVSTLDMDDFSLGTGTEDPAPRGHPGSVVVPSSLALAERQKATGKEMIEAVVAGYEVALRTAWMKWRLAGEPPVAGTAGAYGAAAAAAKLLRLNVEQTSNALGICEAHCPHPSMEDILDNAAMTKEGCGWAAMTGVTAALLAKNGFGGPPTIYDSEAYDKKLLRTLGKDWETEGLEFKPFSTCLGGHSPVDGVMELTKENNLVAGDISKVTIGCSYIACQMTNRRPGNVWQAQYSIPFSVGAALVDGEVGPEQMAENRLADKAILNEADKVELVADDEIDSMPDRGLLVARIVIQTTDGRRFETLKHVPRGIGENRLSDDELEEKFTALVSKVLGSDRAEDLGKRITRLETLASVDEIVERLAVVL